jgi:hypothetical protein
MANASTPADFAIGRQITAVVGPTRVTRTGVVTGHEGQFVVFDAQVDGKTKSLKARPGSINA